MKRLFVALLIVLIPLVVFSEDTLSPPKGNCKDGEVNRCTMDYCVTLTIHCPIIYEDGKVVGSVCNNQPKCNWTCYCVPKEIRTEDFFR